jgi:hypothetical protein
MQRWNVGQAGLPVAGGGISVHQGTGDWAKEIRYMSKSGLFVLIGKTTVEILKLRATMCYGLSPVRQ